MASLGFELKKTEAHNPAYPTPYPYSLHTYLCRLFNNDPLTEPMLNECQLDP